MTDEQKAEISALAEQYGGKKLRFECLQVVNVYGKTAEELSKLNTEYHLADTEMWEAYYKLQRAKAIVCGASGLDTPSQITPNQAGS